LGIENDPALKRIFYYVRQDDLSGSKVKDALSVMIKALHSCYTQNPEEVSKWAIDAYFAEYLKDKTNLEQGILIEDTPPTYDSAKIALKNSNYKDFSWWENFLQNAIKYQRDQYVQAQQELLSAHKETFIGLDGRPIHLVSVVSDNEEMGKAARSKGAELVVVFNSRGNVAVFTSHKRELDLTNSVALLRMAEQHYQGEIKIKDMKILSQENALEGIPWYLIHAKNAIYNGSLTTKDIEPTKIPHDKVVQLVKQGLLSKF
jgi:hypothetical protein